MAALVAALAATPAFAQSNEIIVTATRAGGLSRDVLGISSTVIGPDDLETRQTRAISDVLRDVPGASVSRAGGTGQLTQLRLRGAEANHTMVLIDGIEASDPFQGEFAFESLIADDVARLEVLRGPQSALYGAQAIGGVVSYTTLSGAEAPGVRGRIEYGSFDSWNGAARAAGVAGDLDYALSATAGTTSGTPTARGGARDLGADNQAAAAKGAYAFNDHLRLKAAARYSRVKADVSSQDFNFPPGPTYGFVVDGDGSFKTENLYGLVRLEGEALEGRWSNAVTLQGVSADRDNYEFGSRQAGDEGRRYKASYESTLTFDGDGLRHTLTGAVDFKHETYQNTGPFLSAAQALKREADNTGAVLDYELVAHDKLGLGLAVRRDWNELFDDSTTYRAQASYLFDTGTRLHAAGGSGVTNPGYYELFGFNPASFQGNPHLKPEKSEGWEAGAEQRFLDGKAWIDVTYFDATLTDEIATKFVGPSFTASPVNLATKSPRRGVELSGQAALGAQWRVAAAYTYLDAEQDGLEEVRRPPHIASFNVSWRSVGGRFGAALTVRYNGQTQDSNFTLTGPPRVTLPSFTLVNLGADYRLTENLSVYGRIENLTDEHYEEVYTYASPGRAAVLGLKAGF
jgi:vitamin B12 transporter